MGTYVMSDIHGCYDLFMQMLDRIGFSHTDQLILAGDHIDRGRQNYEMLEWMEHCPQNVRLIRGNHDEEFAMNVDLMVQVDKVEGLGSDFASKEDAAALYASVKYLFKDSGMDIDFFDAYGTIQGLLENPGVTLEDLCRWTGVIRKMPYYYKGKVKERECVVVHAGYTEDMGDIDDSFSCLEDFFLNAREESYEQGGIPHGMVIAGHTPTVAKFEFAFNKGHVFQLYSRAKDCVFCYIDCGCVFRDRDANAKLACVRMEDGKIFYV